MSGNFFDPEHKGPKIKRNPSPEDLRLKPLDFPPIDLIKCRLGASLLTVEGFKPMGGRLRIFAKKGTSAKILAYVLEGVEGAVKDLQLKFNNKYGGSWVLVDQLEPDEHLAFDDGEIYLGYDGRENNRYSPSIKQ